MRGSSPRRTCAQVVAWDVASGRVLVSVAAAATTALALSGDGRRLAFQLDGAADGTGATAAMIDTQTGESVPLTTTDCPSDRRRVRS